MPEIPERRENTNRNTTPSPARDEVRETAGRRMLESNTEPPSVDTRSDDEIRVSYLASFHQGTSDRLAQQRRQEAANRAGSGEQEAHLAILRDEVRVARQGFDLQHEHTSYAEGRDVTTNLNGYEKFMNNLRREHSDRVKDVADKRFMNIPSDQALDPWNWQTEKFNDREWENFSKKLYEDYTMKHGADSNHTKYLFDITRGGVSRDLSRSDRNDPIYERTIDDVLTKWDSQVDERALAFITTLTEREHQEAQGAPRSFGLQNVSALHTRIAERIRNREILETYQKENEQRNITARDPERAENRRLLLEREAQQES